MKKRIGIKMVAFLFVASLLVSGGCTTNRNSKMDNMPGLPEVSSFADDIRDISVPSELEWDRKKSMSIKTESFRGGIWVYRGRAEVLSLKDYMLGSMKDNKWKLVGETTSKDIMLAFTKPSETCIVVISEAMLGKTEMVMYISIDKAAATGMNPFGEAVHQ